MAEEHKDVWGPGIPQYTRDDLLEGEEIIKWAAEIVAQYDLQPERCEMIDFTFKPGQIPNIVCKLDGKLTFIVIKTAIYPDVAKLSTSEKKHYVAHAEKFKAEPLFAPVGFMPTDPARMAAGLALKNDGYYVNYAGLEKVEFKKSQDWIRNALKEIKNIDDASQTVDIPVHKESKKKENFEIWRDKQMSKSFQELLMECIGIKGIENKDFYNAALIDRKLFSAIKNNVNYQPKKETAVACCFGLDLCLPDAEKLLSSAGYILSLSIHWDRIVYYCLQNRITDIDVVNELLYEEGQKCIGV